MVLRRALCAASVIKTTWRSGEASKTRIQRRRDQASTSTLQPDFLSTRSVTNHGAVRAMGRPPAAAHSIAVGRRLAAHEGAGVIHRARRFAVSGVTRSLRRIPYGQPPSTGNCCPLDKQCSHGAAPRVLHTHTRCRPRAPTSRSSFRLTSRTISSTVDAEPSKVRSHCPQVRAEPTRTRHSVRRTVGSFETPRLGSSVTRSRATSKLAEEGLGEDSTPFETPPDHDRGSSLE